MRDGIEAEHFALDNKRYKKHRITNQWSWRFSKVTSRVQTQTPESSRARRKPKTSYSMYEMHFHIISNSNVPCSCWSHYYFQSAVLVGWSKSGVCVGGVLIEFINLSTLSKQRRLKTNNKLHQLQHTLLISIHTNELIALSDNDDVEGGSKLVSTKTNSAHKNLK